MPVDLRIHDVPPETLVAFVEASVAHPSGDLEGLSKFAGFSASTGRRAMPTLEALGVVQRSTDGRYATKVEGVKRGDRDSALLALRRGLQSYRPFEALCEGLSLGERIGDAIRKAALLLDLNGSAVESFQVLLRLGQRLGLLVGERDEITLAPELMPTEAAEHAVLTAEDVESETRARLFNSRWLGRSVNNMLDAVDRDLLADALLSYRSDPSKSVEGSGQALEDFLREIANSNGYAPEARKQNGAAQLAAMLVSKGLAHSHHQKLVEAVSTVRNAKAHRKDKKTLKPWEITSNGAFAALLQTLVAIRSVGEFITSGRQTI